MSFIYGLIDPNTLDVRYIGKAHDPWGRLYGPQGHLKDKYHCYKVHWIQSLLKQNLTPNICIFEQCNETIWQEREKDWIAFGKRVGWPLTNTTDGGEGFSKGCFVSEETRNKIRIANVGKKLSEETKNKLHAINLGNIVSEKTKQLISKNNGRGMLGRHQSEKSKQLLRDNHTGKHCSEETKTKLRQHPSHKSYPKNRKSHSRFDYKAICKAQGTMEEIAKKFNCCRKTVSHIKRRKIL